MLVSILIYVRLKKFDHPAVALGTISFLLYTPFYISALSYYTMGIWFMTAACVLAATTSRKAGYLVSGACYAFSVLCCPYLAVIVLLCPIAAFIGKRFGKPDIQRNGLKFFLFGVVLAAIPVLAFIFSRSSPRDIFRSLPHILSSDPEHPVRSMISILKRYLGAIYYANGSAVSRVCCPILAALFLLSCIDRKCEKRKLFYLLCAWLTILVWWIPFFTDKAHINFLMMPPAVAALFAFLLFPDEKCKKMFLFFWIPAFIYSVCIHASSNQGFYVISGVFCIALPADTVILLETIRRLSTENKIRRFDMVRLACWAVIALQLIPTVRLKYRGMFRLEDPKAQTERIEKGPQKGFYTTPRLKKEYLSRLADADRINAYGDIRSVAFLSERTDYYLMTGKRNGAYSAWLSGVNARTFERLEDYCALHPLGMPDAFLIEGDKEECIALIEETYGYGKTVLESGNVLFLRNGIMN